MTCKGYANSIDIVPYLGNGGILCNMAMKDGFIPANTLAMENEMIIEM
ncbi:MAG: hypothetical protein FWE05_00990 [Defluviitaleaceae bacterium]|nr:hypothetical protein [Defluviitaleaceae bacterium]